MKSLIRCPWCEGFDLYRQYHDTEWGVPLHDSRKLFELLILEGAQAGLSWSTVLKKRETYREALDHFDPKKIGKYDDKKVAELLANPGIIRNRLKVAATIGNAKAYLTLEKSGQPFNQFLWAFVQNKPIQNERRSLSEVPSNSPESDAMSKALLKTGFKFVGTTICYAFMQASGMVNDHLVSCHRHAAVKKKTKA
ncbi:MULTISPECIES: DNA-3-methyladenine glycosylase I [unclassified Polynucleobacter]|jgi:DNA-3-methyladenine glycosylase I|uniref:DNA-3-methyladenine glycosylase I n=1 Tax=unclassified Polynucleobacter TaxID=2640945 RepID=UPI000BCE52DA|nr:MULTISPECIES: DNA-3-methyladenine glycosylase I [unclassified Polynucleobacter]OYY18631.1 MAG: DNA-3-methyladenine glycosylase [Polynucleobacter sp. 35-46-11]OZA76228.1 MAG: DNA-3-methyladenine glycosylase [Polynucleobacter sp. 39-46-10]